MTISLFTTARSSDMEQNLRGACFRLSADMLAGKVGRTKVVEVSGHLAGCAAYIHQYGGGRAS